MSNKKRRNHRGRGSATWVIGLLLTVGGASVIVVTVGLNLSSSLRMNSLLENGGDEVEYVYSDTGSYQIELSEETPNFEVEDKDSKGTDRKETKKKKSKKKDNIESIEVLSEDMKVKPVSEYKNAIKIDSLGITTPVTEGTGKNMQYSVGHFKGTQNFGEVGNACFAGHASTIYQCIFNNLEEIQLGAVINTYTAEGKQVDYVVTQTNIVDPYDWSLVKRKPKKGKILTLVTCTDKGHSRFIVTAKVMGKKSYLKYMKTLRADRVNVISEGIGTVHNQMYFVKDLLLQSEDYMSKFYSPQTISVDNIGTYTDGYDEIVDEMYTYGYSEVSKKIRGVLSTYGVYNREEFKKGVPVGYFTASFI